MFRFELNSNIYFYLLFTLEDIFWIGILTAYLESLVYLCVVKVTFLPPIISHGSRKAQNC